MKTTSRILQLFGYNYLKDIFAPITFAKNFGFLASVLSKIFAIENALPSKNHFLHNARGKSYLLHHLTSAVATGGPRGPCPPNEC